MTTVKKEFTLGVTLLHLNQFEVCFTQHKTAQSTLQEIFTTKNLRLAEGAQADGTWPTLR